MLVATLLPSPTPAIVRTKSVCKHCQVFSGEQNHLPLRTSSPDSTFQAEAYPLLGTEFSLVDTKPAFLNEIELNRK